MIESPNASIKMSAEHALETLEWQNRLEVFHAEIRNAQKILEGLKLNNDEAIKHKTYLEEEVSRLQPIVDSLVEQEAKLSAACKVSRESLAKDAIEISTSHSALEVREENIKKAEDSLVKRNIETKQRDEELDTKTKKLSEDRLEVEQARNVLAQAARSIQWK